MVGGSEADRRDVSDSHRVHNADEAYKARQRADELRASRDREARKKRIAARKSAAAEARDTKPKKVERVKL